MMRELGIALAGAGLVLLSIAAVARWPSLVVWGLAAVGGAYAVSLPSLDGERAIVTAPLVAAGLLVCGEGAFLAVARGAMPGPEPLRRIAWLAGTGLLGIAVSALVLLESTVRAGRSLPMTIVGTLAAVGAVTLLSLRSRQGRPDDVREPSEATRDVKG